jgi:hypothetical protein
LVDSFAPAAPVAAFQSERIYTPEEIEVMKQKLEQALGDYREEAQIAGRLNSEIEKKYTELSNMRMRFRLDQDERLTKQNLTSAIGLANFRAKSTKVSETCHLDRQRIVKSIGFLRSVRDTSNADIKEFEEQSRTNARGIQQLSSSITIAKEDIRDYTEQLQRIDPKLKEYFELKQKHEEMEALVVKLNDEYDSLKREVETESLTANVRRQIDQGNRTLADLNRTIDQILNKVASTQEKVREAKLRCADYEGKLDRVKKDTASLLEAQGGFIEKRKYLAGNLTHARAVNETVGGENEVLSRLISDGVTVGKQPWFIRRELQALKMEVREVSQIEENQQRFEHVLAGSAPVNFFLPMRKRSPLIPMKLP